MDLSQLSDIDIIFNIALWVNFKKSIAIIASCKDLWNLRFEFYKRKHLLWYAKPILNFWTPELHFYASGYQFTLLLNTVTLYMDIIGLFQNNNTVTNIKREYDYCPTFNIENRWLAIWNIYYKSNREEHWSFSFHESREDIKSKLRLNIETDDICSMQYSVIDLQTTIPCWTNFNVEPKIDHFYEWVSLDRLGKIISGE